MISPPGATFQYRNYQRQLNYPKRKSTNAQGWNCYTCKGQTSSDELATSLYGEAEKNFPGRKIRKDWSDGDPDWEENLFPCPFDSL